MFSIIQKVVAYVKDEESILWACEFVLNSIIFCDGLGMSKSFDGACLGHALSKVCSYVTINDKVAQKFNYVFIKSTETNIKKYYLI
jgi:hypothetical protein